MLDTDEIIDMSSVSVVKTILTQHGMNFFSIDLSQRVCRIAGRGRGIGRAAAERFVAAGASVVICSRDAAELQVTLGWDVFKAGVPLTMWEVGERLEEGKD